jgi:hypothetical protein
MSARAISVFAGLVAAGLSSMYVLTKLTQDCATASILTCAARQVLSGPTRALAAVGDEPAAGEARKLAERFEAEEAERRTALALVGSTGEGARSPAAQKERAVREARVESLADLDGTWGGVYAGGLNPRPVQFVLVLRVYGNSCHGRTEEPNTFGHPSAPRLYANVECRLVGWPQRLVFRKTYDGTGGQFHSVDYDGEISLDGRSVIGTWRIGTLSGPFSLARQ